MKECAWVQAAIDVEDIVLAEKIAFMALDAGAEWLEVGTPLLYQYGHAAIGRIRKAVGKNAVLVADYKSPFAGLCAEQAAREGADYIMVSAGYDDRITEHSVKASAQAGIRPIFDLAVHPRDLRSRAEQLHRLGAEFLFTRRTSQFTLDDGGRETADHLPALLVENRPYLLGITSDRLEEAQACARAGADWITFGWVLRTPDPAICKQWIDSIHAARNAESLTPMGDK